MRAEDTGQAREAWDRIADGYDAFVTPTHLWLAEESLRHVGVRAGTRFLDVASGSGALSIPAARAGARVTATDHSPRMVERLRERALAEGVRGLEAVVMDGQALELEDDTFDVAGSQFGVMLFPDLPRGLAEMARVTKPGGRVFINVYGAPHHVEFLTFFMKAVRAAAPGFEGLPTDPLPLPFQASDPDVLHHRLEEAGLQDVRVDTVTEHLTFSSARQMWNWLLNSNPIPGMLLADVTEAERAEARRILEGMIRERAGGGDRAVLTNPVHIGTGIA